MTANVAAFFSAIIGAVIGSLSAFFFNVIHWNTIRRFELLDKEVLMIKELINEFKGNCLQYWALGNFNSGEAYHHSLQDQYILEAKIKSDYRTIVKYIHAYSKNNFSFDDGNNWRGKFLPLLSKLFDSSTSGDFESKTRKANSSRCIKIVSTVTDLDILLYSSTHQEHKIKDMCLKFFN